MACYQSRCGQDIRKGNGELAENMAKKRKKFFRRENKSKNYKRTKTRELKRDTNLQNQPRAFSSPLGTN